MKTAILTLCLLAPMLQPPTMVLAKTRQYPMRVQVVRSRWHGRRGWHEGFGRANLMSQQPGQPPRQGMDFTYSCSEPVRISFGPDTYLARYGKNPLEVIVGMPQPGTTKLHECTLAVEMRNYIYVRTGHGLAAKPLGGGPPSPLQDDRQGNQ